jgi:hypothetical protein
VASPLCLLKYRFPRIAYLQYKVAQLISSPQKTMCMFHNLSSAQMLFIAVGTICLYVLILGVVFGKKLVATWLRPAHSPVLQTSSSPHGPSPSWSRQDNLPPLIDKPADHPAEQAHVYSDAEDPYFELTEDGSVTLLKSAEQVVEQIQDVVDNIASRPANPDEVFTKIRAIVSDYSFFLDTEYYDAINSFVAVTVQRDCDLALTEEDLKALWYAEAA